MLVAKVSVAPVVISPATTVPFDVPLTVFVQ